MRKVSIIIPTKDEPYIQKLVEKIHKILKIKHEIIVVDKSEVVPKVKGAKVIRQKSDGLGKAFLEGLNFAKGDVIVLMDGDGSHRPEDLPKLIEKTKEYDIVIGSKYVKGGKTKDKFYRILISKFYCFLASLILGLEIKDNMSGFSAVRRKVYEKIKLDPIGFKINTELLFKAKKFGFKTSEIPIVFEE
ncbi:MAG: glycosyltransferase, partial [Candidatus Aenigmatarchaeota archaeon]